MVLVLVLGFFYDRQLKLMYLLKKLSAKSLP